MLNALDPISPIHDMSLPPERPAKKNSKKSSEKSDAPESSKLESGELEPTELEPIELEAVAITEETVLETLQHGSMEPKDLLPYSSNHSFLVTVTVDDLALPAVYKPRRGENPLWDFARGTLCQREVAAYEISVALDWRLVPPTVLREGTHGIGSVQFFVDHDQNDHYFTVQYDARFTDTLRQLALFDFITNNADRKSGHCLAGYDEQLWAIDHGICFHTEYKLRTVIWEFSQQPIESDLLADLQTLQTDLADKKSVTATRLADLLSADEVDALSKRLATLIESTRYPSPSPFQRNYPWPPV